MFLILLTALLLPACPLSEETRGAMSCGEETAWGKIIAVRDRGVRSQICGFVVFSDETPAEKALVEVYPDETKKEDRAVKYAVHRVAACETTSSGCFQFDSIPPGKYEVRCSLKGFCTFSIFNVTLAPRCAKAKQKPLKLYLAAD